MKVKLINAIEDTRFFRGFSTEECDHILTAGRAETRSFTKDEVLFYEKTILNSIIIILDGRIQGVHLLADGSINLVELFLPGNVIGLDIVCSSSRRSPYSLCGMDSGSIVLIDYDSIFSERLNREVMKKLQENLIHELARDSLKRLHKIEVLYRKSLRERICIFLRNRSSISGERVVEIDMDREQFAQYLGVNRSSLSHELAMMRQDGLIEFHKGHFTILSDEVLG